MKTKIKAIEVMIQELKQDYYELKQCQIESYDQYIAAVNSCDEEKIERFRKEEEEAFRAYDNVRHAINDLGSALYFLSGKEIKAFFG